MTESFSKSSGSDQVHFDIAPLSWVIGELRDSLSNASKLLNSAVSQNNDLQATSLLQAKSFLHQVHGALQIVEVEGVAIVTETVEELIERIQSGKLLLTSEVALKISNSFHAVLHYLEELLTGAAPQPVKLFPEYKELLELKGAERIHPADLFFPALSVQEKIPELNLNPNLTLVDYSALRLKFEKLLLVVLTSKDVGTQSTSQNRMGELIQEIVDAQSSSQTKAFWLVMKAFSEASIELITQDERHIKQIWGRVNLQIRRLVDGNVSIPERLLRDALFFIAQVEQPSDFVAQIKKAYQLENNIPKDFNEKKYGIFDSSIIASTKEQLSHVKNLWGRISNGDATLKEKFHLKIKELKAIGMQLEIASLSQLLTTFQELSEKLVDATEKEKVGLEFATALLFVENLFEKINHLPTNTQSQVDEICSRLMLVSEGKDAKDQSTWMGEISREAQQKETLDVLVSEMQSSLKLAEKGLDDFFRDTSNLEFLTPVDKILTQVGGALVILDQDEARQAIEYSRDLIKQFLSKDEETDHDALEENYKKVAQNIGALSFFLETLQSQPEIIKERFTFDVDQGLFITNLVSKKTEKGLLPNNPLLLDPNIKNTSTAEQDLLEQQRNSNRLLASLAETPSDSLIKEQLKTSLDTERSFATLLDDSEAGSRASKAIDLLGKSDLNNINSSINELVEVTTHQEHKLPEILDVVIPENDEAIDAELLEIFLSEADEVLEAVVENIPLSRSDASNQEFLIRLRRSFHTLKGSGRMVGLTEFGESAWSVEEVMNFWLSESKNGTEALYGLLDFVCTEMHVWVDELKKNSYSSRTSSVIVKAANKVRDGHDFEIEQLETTHVEDVDLGIENDGLVTQVEVDLGDSVEIIEESAVADTNDFLSLNEIGLSEPEVLLQNESVQNDQEQVIGVSVEQENLGDLLVEEASLDELLTLQKELDEIDHAVIEEEINDSAELIAINSLDEKVEDSPSQQQELEDVLVEANQLKTAKIIEFPDVSSPQLAEDDSIKKIGNIEVSLALHNIYMTETDEIVRYLAQDFSEWRLEAARTVSRQAVHASHSLAGSSATVGLFSVQEVAHSLENVLQRLERHPVVLEQTEFDLLENTVVLAKEMIRKFGVSELALQEPEMVKQLNNLLETVIKRSDSGVVEEFITSTNEILDPDLLSLENNSINELTSQGDEVMSTDEALDVSENAVDEPNFVDEAVTIVEPNANLAKFITEDVTQEIAKATHQNEVAELINKLDADTNIDLINNAQVNEELIRADELSDSLDSLEVDDYETEEEQENEEVKIEDELDIDLLPVFIEEGNDLLPMVGQLLRSWQDTPEDNAIPQSILRLMHTIKGSARMAGAMKLGQHTHEMETRIENLMVTGGAIRQPLIEDLLTRHDHANQLFEQLQNPDVVFVDTAISQVSQVNEQQKIAPVLSELRNEAESDVEIEDVEQVSNVTLEHTLSSTQDPEKAEEIKPIVPVVSRAITSTAKPNLAPLATAGSTSASLVRVRADILDRLVNQAGEVSISRSKLENEVDTLRSSLTELSDNISRLRDQLREVEIQAETQITSRMALSGDREFDPLEFDRFTRLQELTRMMAESVSDVATVQTTLGRTIDGASNDLHTQARLTRELQQDLMRVRMIPFASVSERLFRIARQTSKELDKRVNLDIRGTSVEIDRGVLEKMTAPFEHLLRNAIVHGIESKQARLAQGKNEVGELLIEIKQEGNEVVIHFTDDGQGINVNRIRDKAQKVGLLTHESQVSENELVNLIFEPGFSTASEVTEIAGRGVGMDVVRSEAASLGGRVSVTTIEGQGAHFTIHLPLTLAVTQVVIISVGGQIYAVPSVLVEQVQQLKTTALANAYNEGSILWQGSRVPLHYLPSMLGEKEIVPSTQQYTPVMIMKSDNERVAIHVDQIVGNREVVVKNVGPQLSRMIGIAGATVMGSGDIVLILNPVPLAQKIEHERAQLSDHDLSKLEADLGAVAEMSNASLVTQSVQGLRKQNVVMVVDDSLTVRRVTQRLLVREGYQVVLAKDGIDALEQLQSITPDVMLLDIEMPRMDGFDLARNIRADARTHSIPIIMITSRTADKHRNYAAELGVNEYFGKPFREAELLAAISSFVNSKQSVH